MGQANAHLADINGRLRRIVETTQGFSVCIEVSSIRIRILDGFADHMCASGGSLYFVEADWLRLVHALDEGHAAQFIPFPLPQYSIFNRVLEGDKPLLIEDFGTGYSSLSYLRNYPFNTLKIDRSFINEITTHAADKELVSAVITMGRNLGLHLVAEGVEIEQQLLMLEELECELAQGYLFSKPVSPETIPGLIASPKVAPGA